MGDCKEAAVGVTYRTYNRGGGRNRAEWLPSPVGVRARPHGTKLECNYMSGMKRRYGRVLLGDGEGVSGGPMVLGVAMGWERG